MTAWLASFCLFADNERFRALSRGFRGDGAALSLTDSLLALACLAAAVLAVVILARLVSRPERKAEQNHPGRLFRSLCRTHGLGFQSRRALWTLAKDAGLAHPAILFVSPALFDARLDAVRGVRQQARYGKLREQLFGPRPQQVAKATATH